MGEAFSRGDILANRGTPLIDSGGDLCPGNVGGQLIHLPFGKADLTTGLDETAVLPIGGAAALGADYPMVKAGSVIGVGFYSNAAITTGSISVYACINGTTKLLATLNTTNQSTAVTQNKDTDTFTAKQRIGVKVSTSADLDSETKDVWGAVIVEI